MSIRGLVWAFIGIGMLMMYFYLWPAMAGIYETVSSNATWSHSATVNATITSPTSEAISGSWKYIMLFVGVGGILFLIFTALKGGGRSDE